MIGQIYCLVRPAAAVLRNPEGKTSCVVLPEGSVIVVENSSNDGRTLKIRCDQREFWMFSVDLMARGANVTEELKRSAEAATKNGKDPPK